jgi:hypothetical protein
MDIDLYRHWTIALFQSALIGWPARFLALACLCLAFWRGVIHQQFILAFIFYGFSVLFTYSGAVVRLFTP